MCRFLIVKREEEFDPKPLLREFASACQKSRTPEGDWQGDGWGIAWLDEESRWQVRKSPSPIWEERGRLERITQTKICVAHARSASFTNQTGVLDYNQPYVNGDACFVFNGLVRKVRLARPVEGEIGAQKIWTLIQEYLSSGSDLDSALRETRELLRKNSAKIRGLNIGLVANGKAAALCEYTQDPDYFTLWYGKTGKRAIVCSEPLSGYNLSPISKGEIKVL